MRKPVFYTRDAGGTITPTDDPKAFERMYHNDEQMDIETTQIGPVFVATVFTGMDCNESEIGPPLLFQTLVFGGELDDEQRELWRAAMRPVWDQFDGDMAIGPNADGNSDQNQPAEQIRRRLQCPDDSGVEDVTQHDLSKGQQRHRGEKRRRQVFF